MRKLLLGSLFHLKILSKNAELYRKVGFILRSYKRHFLLDFLHSLTIRPNSKLFVGYLQNGSKTVPSGGGIKPKINALLTGQNSNHLVEQLKLLIELEVA